MTFWNEHFVLKRVSVKNSFEYGADVRLFFKSDIGFFFVFKNLFQIYKK